MIEPRAPSTTPGSWSPAEAYTTFRCFERGSVLLYSSAYICKSPHSEVQVHAIDVCFGIFATSAVVVLKGKCTAVQYIYSIPLTQLLLTLELHAIDGRCGIFATTAVAVVVLKGKVYRVPYIQLSSLSSS